MVCDTSPSDSHESSEEVLCSVMLLELLKLIELGIKETRCDGWVVKVVVWVCCRVIEE